MVQISIFQAILLTHPDIVDAAVIGVPDENAGELPFAFVVRKPNAKLTEKQVIDFVASKFERMKVKKKSSLFYKIIHAIKMTLK